MTALRGNSGGGGITEVKVVYTTPTVMGSPNQLADNITIVVYDPDVNTAGIILRQEILPANPVEGQIIKFMTGSQKSAGQIVVTSLSIQAATGQTLYNAPTAVKLFAGEVLSFVYHATGKVWTLVARPSRLTYGDVQGISTNGPGDVAVLDPVTGLLPTGVVPSTTLSPDFQGAGTDAQPLKVNHAPGTFVLSSGNIAIDLGQSYAWKGSTLTSNATLTFSNSQDGSNVLPVITHGAYIDFTSDATAGRTITFPAGTKRAGAGGNVYTMSGANHTDRIFFTYDGTNFTIVNILQNLG